MNLRSRPSYVGHIDSNQRSAFEDKSNGIYSRLNEIVIEPMDRCKGVSLKYDAS